MKQQEQVQRSWRPWTAGPSSGFSQSCREARHAAARGRDLHQDQRRGTVSAGGEPCGRSSPAAQPTPREREGEHDANVGRQPSEDRRRQRDDDDDTRQGVVALHRQTAQLGSLVTADGEVLIDAGSAELAKPGK